MTIQELERCIALYGKDIYSFCFRLTGNKETADDLYQDTFLEAIKKLPNIRYKDNPKSYLLSIAIRLWKNTKRKAAWRARILPRVSSDEISESSIDSAPDQINTIIKKEETQYLWDAIDRLAEQYRIPILLYYMEELSTNEISSLLSIPLGTVKSRLHHARKQLEKELEEYFS